jgi:hypothetical protein
MLRPRPYSSNIISLASDSVKLKLADFIYHDATGERTSELQDPFNFQRPLGRLALLDAEVYDLLVGIRHVLKPLTLGSREQLGLVRKSVRLLFSRHHEIHF